MSQKTAALEPQAGTDLCVIGLIVAKIVQIH